MSTPFAPASRRTAYAVLGAFLALGAPLGLLLSRAARASAFSPDWILAEVSGDPLTYAYVLVSTVVAFALFGAALGFQSDRVAALSAVDPLTGLANRRVFEQRLKAEFAGARRYGVPLSLLLIDVDGLKEINDHDGHAAGDAALRRVADALAQTLRSTDMGARWGGDEFALVAPNTPGPAAWTLAERLRREAALPEGQGRSVPTTASVGIVTLEPASLFADESALLVAADRALYEAKRRGRNCGVAWRPDAPPPSLYEPG